MINLYTSTASMQSGGIFTLEKEHSTDGGPVSAILFHKQHSKDAFVNVESKLTSFFEAFLNCESLKIKYRFGLKILVGNKVEHDEEQSKAGYNKIVIFINGERGYERLCSLYSQSISGTSINTITYEQLADYYSQNCFKIAIPFYDSYLYKNNLTFDYCLPKFLNQDIVYFVENNGLPFDEKLASIVRKVDKPVLEVQTCYYSKPEDYKKFLVYRTMLQGETFNKPNIENMFSNNFYPKYNLQ